VLLVVELDNDCGRKEAVTYTSKVVEADGHLQTASADQSRHTSIAYQDPATGWLSRQVVLQIIFTDYSNIDQRQVLNDAA
jgi:hypothetical protein